MGAGLVRASALSGRSGLDVDACPVAKPSQHPHRVLPHEAKGCHVRKAEPSDHVANDLEVRLVELALVEGIMGPGGDCIGMVSRSDGAVLAALRRGLSSGSGAEQSQRRLATAWA